MKKVVNTKKLLFENMEKLNPDFKMRGDVDEISTGLAQRASGAASDKWSSNTQDSPVTARKADYQNAKFSRYVNPELKSFLMKQFSDVPNFDVFKEGETVVLKFPYTNKTEHPTLAHISVNIKPDKYFVSRGIEDQFGRINNENGGEGYLPQPVLTRLPNIIKRVQADMRGEKGMFNPTKPIPTPQPEPVPVSQPEPVQQAQKPMGLLDKFKSKFGKNAS